jgi:hypothetical protein
MNIHTRATTIGTQTHRQTDTLSQSNALLALYAHDLGFRRLWLPVPAHPPASREPRYKPCPADVGARNREDEENEEDRERERRHRDKEKRSKRAHILVHAGVFKCVCVCVSTCARVSLTLSVCPCVCDEHRRCVPAACCRLGVRGWRPASAAASASKCRPSAPGRATPKKRRGPSV